MSWGALLLSHKLKTHFLSFHRCAEPDLVTMHHGWQNEQIDSLQSFQTWRGQTNLFMCMLSQPHITDLDTRGWTLPLGRGRHVQFVLNSFVQLPDHLFRVISLDELNQVAPKDKLLAIRSSKSISQSMKYICNVSGITTHRQSESVEVCQVFFVFFTN